MVFVPDELSDEDMGPLHLAGDAFISLTRGEGFGVGAFEAAAAGKPVIMTGWGGRLDFLPTEDVCLVVRLGGRPGTRAFGPVDGSACRATGIPAPEEAG